MWEWSEDNAVEIHSKAPACISGGQYEGRDVMNLDQSLLKRGLTRKDPASRRHFVL